MRYRAIFLDRDGTLVEPRHYPTRPDDLVLYPRLAPALRRLRSAGFKLVVVTNQSGIARGYLNMQELRDMHRSLSQRLARLGVQIDRYYHCPHHPDGVVPGLSVSCTCRKPQPGMLLRAASELHLDLERSWLVGDILADVEAGNRALCRTVLVDLGTEGRPDAPIRMPDIIARSTRHALDAIAAAEQLAPMCEMTYLPERWFSSTPASAPCAARPATKGGANG
jgi:D-glycero-D-manno-heptose 1,7-bisphosphate phosphatase